jgi:hypothetical protein
VLSVTKILIERLKPGIGSSQQSIPIEIETETFLMLEIYAESEMLILR